MPQQEQSVPLPDEKKSRQQLLQELADLRRRLTAAEKNLSRPESLPHPTRAVAPETEDRSALTLQAAQEGILPDISERKQAGQTLQESEHRFALLFEKAPCPMALSQWEDGALVDVNAQWEKTFGYSRREARGRTSAELGMIREPRERARLQDEFKQCGALRERELSLFTRTGEERICSTSVETVVLGGQRYRLSSVQDITERRRAEEALKRERDILQAVMNGAPQFHLAYLDRSFTFVRVNETYARSCGYRPEQMIGLNHFTLFPDAENEAIFTRVRDGGEPVVFHDKPFTYPDQPQRGMTWWDWMLVPVKDAGGSVEGLTFSLVETTERVRAQKALRESRDDLNRAQAVAHIGSWRFMRKQEELRWSEETYRIFGVPVDTPMTFARFQALVHPDDRDYVEQKWQAALRGETRYDIEHRIVAGGEVKWVHERAEMEYDPAGILQGGFGTVQDISERKRAEQAVQESEQKFRSLVENASDGIVLTDEQGLIIEWNPAQEAITGLPQSVVLGQPLWEVQCRTAYRETGTPPDTERVRSIIRSMLTTGQIPPGVQGIERAIRRADGERRILQSVTYAIPTRQGFRLGGTSRDVTEHRRTENALQALNVTLEQQVAERTAVAESRARQLQALALQLTEAEERVRRRIADLLHDDLQQLLTASRYQLSVLHPTLQANETATLILHQVDQLLGQSIEKSRRLSHELSPAVLHHSGLGAAVEWLAHWMEEHHGLHVEVDTKAKSRLDNEALAAFLFRSVQELLLNAVKHSGSDHARVTIKTADNQVLVEVADSGKGFAPQSLEASRKPGEGFGLLSLRERVRYLGGNLAIDSSPGKGSRISLTVPLEGLKASQRVAPSPPEHASHPAPEETRPRAERHARYRVLIADDHPMMRQGLIAVLDSQSDIEVIGEAADGREAVEMTRRLQPDVVVMDVVMPQMDGIEATAIIKRESPQVRVIGLSMLADEKIARRLKKAGAEGFVPKEQASEALLEAIQGKYNERLGG